MSVWLKITVGCLLFLAGYTPCFSKDLLLIPKINGLIKQLRAQSKIDLWINEYLTYYKSTTTQSPQKSPTTK